MQQDFLFFQNSYIFCVQHQNQMVKKINLSGLKDKGRLKIKIGLLICFY